MFYHEKSDPERKIPYCPRVWFHRVLVHGEVVYFMAICFILCLFGIIFGMLVCLVRYGILLVAVSSFSAFRAMVSDKRSVMYVYFMDICSMYVFYGYLVYFLYVGMFGTVLYLSPCPVSPRFGPWCPTRGVVVAEEEASCCSQRRMRIRAILSLLIATSRTERAPADRVTR
jgi:hypothetical protein